LWGRKKFFCRDVGCSPLFFFVVCFSELERFVKAVHPHYCDACENPWKNVEKEEKRGHS